MKKYNIIHLKKGQYLIWKNDIIYTEKDTIIYLPAEEEFIIRKNNSKSLWYEKLKERAYKKKWTKEIHDIVIIPSNNKTDSTSVVTKLTEVPYLKYSGSIIRNISIRKLQVFGASINNPDGNPKYFMGKIGNRLHIHTHDRVIKNYLLFRSYDRLDPFMIAETERIMREQSYIEDVKILIIPYNEDSVDIELLVKDNWSKGVNMSLSSLNEFSVQLWDNNIFGTGKLIENEYFSNPDRKPKNGLNGQYLQNNIFGTFLNFRLQYGAIGNQYVATRLWRDFFTQKTQYAGELYYEKADRNYMLIRNDSINEWYYFPLAYRKFNGWVGRAFPIEQFFFISLFNISVSGGIFHTKYFNRPFVSENYRYALHNKTFILTSFSFSSINHYRSSLVYSFGRTEDIPYGLLINFTHGIENNEFKTRLYHSLTLVGGNQISQLGFGYFNFSIGSFINKNKTEQGIIRLGCNYFTNLLVINKFKIRNFFSINYTRGVDRFEDEKLTINDFAGVRGYRNDSAIGTQKIIGNFETVIFTPYTLADFRVAFFGFFDLACINDNNTQLFKGPFYSGMGIGVRLRNERLVFKTIQIRLAYYPRQWEETIGDLLNISTEWRFRPPSMYIKSPQIIEFK